MIAEIRMSALRGGIPCQKQRSHQYCVN